jgi:hypothetical protein
MEDYAALFDLHQAFWGAFVEWALCSFIEDCASLFDLHQAFWGSLCQVGIMFFHRGLPAHLCSTFKKHFRELSGAFVKWA